MRLRAPTRPAALLFSAALTVGLALTPTLSAAGTTPPGPGTGGPVIAQPPDQTLPGGGYTLAGPGQPGTQIIGGDPADEVYPGVASLQLTHPRTGEQHFHTCGAWQFSGYWVVTNAHCVTDERGNPYPAEFNLHIRTGTNDRTAGGVTANVTTIVPHFAWAWGAVPGAPVSDLAMLKVDRYLDLPALVIPARGPKTGTTVRTVGWGMTEPSSNQGPLPTVLRQLDGKLLPAAKCAPAGITAGEVCVSNARGTDGVCYGDSGSPLLWREQAGGTLRWRGLGGASRTVAELCGVSPAVYTDAVHFREWIYAVARTGANPATPLPRPAGDLRVLSGLAWRAALTG